MSLPDYIGSSQDGPISAIRRQTIALAIAAASAIGALFYLLSAALLALEPLVGDVMARLLVSAAFIAIGFTAIFVPRMFHTQSVAERARSEAEALTPDQKIAMIIEAVMMGFSLSSRSKDASDRN